MRWRWTWQTMPTCSKPGICRGTGLPDIGLLVKIRLNRILGPIAHRDSPELTVYAPGRTDKGAIPYSRGCFPIDATRNRAERLIGRLLQRGATSWGAGASCKSFQHS